MYHFSELRPIKRSDLASHSSTSSSDDDDDAGTLNGMSEVRLREQLNKLYQDNFTDLEPDQSRPGDVAVDESANERTYDFKLIAKPSQPVEPEGTNKVHQRIALRSPTPQVGDPDFLTPRRPDGYYFTGETVPERFHQYQTAAVSSSDVLEGVNKSWPGLALPWKVTVLKFEGKPLTTQIRTSLQESSGKRTRIGKKRRIAIRQKLAAKDAMAHAAQQSQADKEAAEREKRTRRNREKKIKKKQKEKMKKSQEQDD